MKKKPRIKIKCPVCQKVFANPFHYRQSKYCSKACWAKRNPQITIECEYCGKSIWVYKSQSDRKKYCSRKCYALDQRIKQKGNKSHLWQGGKTNSLQIHRTRSIYRKWRLSVFERDSYTCQLCGKRSGNGKKIIIHAHHIEEFSKHTNKRYDINNGVTLCNKCHILQHPHLIRREIAAKRLAQEVLPL